VYGVVPGRRLGLPDDDLVALHRGGYLHDLGKIAIPDAILLKQGPLTHAEQELMQQHPVIGDRLCGNLRVLTNVRPACEILLMEARKGWRRRDLVELFVDTARAGHLSGAIGHDRRHAGSQLAPHSFAEH
jgi:response regulator RpfG family c-di-GMP phosphodiesterase